jgi:branched-chain amino acid transport system permease protein
MIAQLIANGMIAGCIYALVALGFAIIYGTVRFFHFAHGVVFAIGAYVAWTCVSHFGLALPLAAIVSVFVAGLFGVIIDLCIYRSLRKRKAQNLVLLLASFGIFLFTQNSIQLLYGSDIKILQNGPVSEGYRYLGAAITGSQIAIIMFSGVLTGAVVLFMQRTPFGKAIRAVADDPLAVSLMGINSQRVISLAFFLGSSLAGAAGVLVAL